MSLVEQFMQIYEDIKENKVNTHHCIRLEILTRQLFDLYKQGALECEYLDKCINLRVDCELMMMIKNNNVFKSK